MFIRVHVNLNVSPQAYLIALLHILAHARDGVEIVQVGLGFCSRLSTPDTGKYIVQGVGSAQAGVSTELYGRCSCEPGALHCGRVHLGVLLKAGPTS